MVIGLSPKGGQADGMRPQTFHKGKSVLEVDSVLAWHSYNPRTKYDDWPVTKRGQADGMTRPRTFHKGKYHLFRAHLRKGGDC